MKASTTNGNGLDSYRSAVNIIQIAPMFGEMNRIATNTISIWLWGNHDPMTIHPHKNPRPPIKKIHKVNLMSPSLLGRVARAPFLDAVVDLRRIISANIP
jgi:hypothetical protein